MNLIEKYISTPHNYILEGSGGFGKSTTLKYMAKSLHGRKLGKKTILAAYIPLSEFNLKRATPNMLIDYFKEYFNYEITDKAFFDMIKESQDTIQYLILLDGLNEIHNYEVNGQTVANFLFNDIGKLLDHENVNVIISTRSVEFIPGFISLKSKRLVLKSLSDNKISRYLEIDNMDSIPSHLREMLKNPMLLKIFRTIYLHYPEQALLIDNKYEMLEQFFVLDIHIHTQKEFSDYLQDVRMYVVKNIIPYIAFQAELAMLLSNISEKQETLDYEEAIKKAYDFSKEEENISFELVLEVVAMLGIMNENLNFTHDLLREYFVAKGMLLLGESGDYECIRSFLGNLIQQLAFVSKRDLYRRTRFLGVAEFVFSAVKDRLCDQLVYFGGTNKKEILCLAQDFYQELSGVHDDLSNGDEAARVGWVALDYLKKVEQYYDEIELARRYNFVYYSVKWDKNEHEKCQRVILYAKDIMDNLGEDSADDKKKYRALYGKVLSNMGSYYYKLGAYYKGKNDYPKMRENILIAQNWHTESLEYRQKYCSKKDQVNSYRTLMSDAYQLKKYRIAYDYYLDALDALAGKRKLREILAWSDDIVDEDLVERALGSEIELLKQGEDKKVIKAIMDELMVQINHVLKKSISPDRINYRMLASLGGKLVQLSKWAEETGNYELKKRLDTYYDKCKEY